MAKLVWDAVGQRQFETGTSKGILFPINNLGTYDEGKAWNGLSSVKQSPDGADESPIYANNKKYLSLTSAENFKGSIEAYTYPDEFMECDGSKEVIPGVYLGQQERKSFGLVYSTIIGNDTEGMSFGEKIHVIYGAKVAPSERAYETVNEDPNALLFSWEFSTVPQEVTREGFKPTAYVAIDTTKLAPEKITEIKAILYGDEATESRLPDIDELMELVDPAPAG
jgi:hypothetical protein